MYYPLISLNHKKNFKNLQVKSLELEDKHNVEVAD